MKAYAEYVDSGSNWLGQLPVGWLAGRLDHVAAAWPSNVDKHSIVGQPAVRLCNYRDVYQNDSIIEGMEFMVATATEEQIERFRLRRGDTIITKDSETADDIGVPSYVSYEAPDLICGYHLAIVRPTSNNAVPRYLYWALCSQPTRRQWALLASGVTRVGIRSTDLSKIALPLPPTGEQRAIADFLDRETAQIDTLIAKQKALIATLRERRSGVVDRSIASAMARTSGQRLKHLVTEVVHGWSPQCLPWPADGINDWAVLKAGAANGGTFRPSENKTLPDGEAARPQSVAREGSLLVSRANTRELLGSAAVVDGYYPRLMLCDKLYALTLDPRWANPRFVATAMGTRQLRDLIELEASGSSPSMQNVSQADILNLPMGLPSVAAQNRALQLLDEQTGKIDTLVAKAERFIELAKERRAALITAAVTGQIQVPT